MTPNYHHIAAQIIALSHDAGFDEVAITDCHLGRYTKRFKAWLAQRYHGDMKWLENNQQLRFQPQQLFADTIRIVSLRMDYLPEPQQQAIDALNDTSHAYISRYALGQDYHRLLRKKLARLIKQIKQQLPHLKARVFTDSAPILEKPIAEKAGLGWIGKHTNLINQRSGSWFFLAEIFVNLPLPLVSQEPQSHCGSCQKCIEVCPTQAIIAPYILDAKKCISYLTIEYKGSIPLPLRSQMGNRVFGCDDCQLFCPWNRFASISIEQAFQPRKSFIAADFVTFFNWDASQFKKRTQNSPLGRISHEQWRRNLAIGMGNAPFNADIVQTLQRHVDDASMLVREHVRWALHEQIKGLSSANLPVING